MSHRRQKQRPLRGPSSVSGTPSVASGCWSAPPCGADICDCARERAYAHPPGDRIPSSSAAPDSSVRTPRTGADTTGIGVRRAQRARHPPPSHRTRVDGQRRSCEDRAGPQRPSRSVGGSRPRSTAGGHAPARSTERLPEPPYTPSAWSMSVSIPPAGISPFGDKHGRAACCAGRRSVTKTTIRVAGCRRPGSRGARWGRTTGRRSLRTEPDRGHPASSRDGPAEPVQGPPEFAERPGWPAPRRSVDEWTALVLPTARRGRSAGRKAGIGWT